MQRGPAPHPQDRLIVHTTAPSNSVSANVVPRRPIRSNTLPIGRQTAAPRSVAQRLILAYVTRSICRSRSIGSVIKPSPWVRPGSVASMMAAATKTFSHPAQLGVARLVAAASTGTPEDVRPGSLSEECRRLPVLRVPVLQPVPELRVVLLPLLSPVTEGVVAQIEEPAVL